MISPSLVNFTAFERKFDDGLTDAQLVADHVIDGHIFKAHLVVHAAGFEVLCKHIIKAVGELAQAKRLAFKLHAARFDTGHIQNIVDERKQVVGKLVDFLKILHRGVIFFQSLPSASVSMPMMPFIGVRISCDMRERNVVLRLVGFLRLHQALFIALYAAVHFSRFREKGEKTSYPFVPLCITCTVIHSPFCMRNSAVIGSFPSHAR